MRRSIMMLLALAAFTSVVKAQPTSAEFQGIYMGMIAKIKSSATPEEKIRWIRAQDDIYVQMVRKMMTDSNQNPEILKDPAYDYAWNLYDKIIPLTKVKLDPDTLQVSERSCLEASRLVQPAPAAGQGEELALGGLAIDDQEVSKALGLLCAKKK